MILVDQIRADTVTALKAGEGLRVSVLRMLSSEFNYKKIEVQRELTDVDVISVIQREVKKRQEAIASFTAGGRTEQAEKERQELLILQEYIPKQMSEEEVKGEIERMNLPKDFVGAMKIASPEFRGKADGKMVAELVKKWLSS